MSEQSNILKQVAGGAGIIFIGTFLFYVFRFAYQVVIARYLGPEDYGLISLGIMILNLSILIPLLGINEGIVHYIAYYRSIGNKIRLKSTFLTALKITLPLSIITTATLIFFSKQIAINLFHNAELTPILIIFSLIIPFYTLLILAVNAMVALKKPEYTIISRIFGREFINLLLTITIVLIGGTVLQLSLIYLLSFAIGSLLSLYLLEYKVFPFIRSKIKTVHEYKELLAFSMPLFFSGIFLKIMSSIDTFFLGYMKTTVDVGIYNAVLPLAASLGIFLIAFSQMFYPIMSELHAKKQHTELARTYSIVLRWIFMLSFPVMILSLLFPKYILSILFGTNYATGATAFTILIVAYFIDVITGPAVRILMTLKKTKLIFYINAIVMILNVVLNIILIPLYGITGAAIATGISIVLREIIIFNTARKYIQFGYKLKSYFKYTLSAILPVLLIYPAMKLITISIISLMVAVAVFFGLYLLLLLLFKSFRKEDKMIILAMSEKVGIDLTFFEEIVKKFQ
jgi:O-antigen/teichoic acid export membrane protein